MTRAEEGPGDAPRGEHAAELLPGDEEGGRRRSHPQHGPGVMDELDLGGSEPQRHEDRPSPGGLQRLDHEQLGRLLAEGGGIPSPGGGRREGQDPVPVARRGTQARVRHLDEPARPADGGGPAPAGKGQDEDAAAARVDRQGPVAEGEAGPHAGRPAVAPPARAGPGA